MTYYIKGGSRYNEANPTVWCALILGGFSESLYTDVDWKLITYESRVGSQDPYWLLGGATGGAKEFELGLYGDYRIKFETTGITYWDGDSWEDLLAEGGAENLNELTDVVITGTPADNEGLFYDTGTSKWINQTAGEAGLALSGHEHTLDQITNPSGDKEFNFANKHLHYKWVAPASGAHEGAFEIEASGAFSGDLMHIHQHTGVVGAGTYMVFIECEHANASCLHLVHDPDILDFGAGGLLVGADARITEFDTSPLANSDTKVPTNTTVKEYTDTFALLKVGGEISGNITCAGAETFDGVDVSDLKTAFDALSYYTQAEVNGLLHAQAHTLASHTTKAHAELSDAPTSAHHVKYADSDAVSAVATADVYVKNDGDTMTGDLTFTGASKIESATDNLIFNLGRNKIGHGADYAYFGYRGFVHDQFAIRQTPAFLTLINAGTGQTVDLGIAKVIKMSLATALLTMSVPIAMGANKITGLGDGVAAQDAMAFGQKYTLEQHDNAYHSTNYETANTNIQAHVATPATSAHHVKTVKYTAGEVDARIVVQNTHPAGTIDIATDQLIANHKAIAGDHHAKYTDADVEDANNQHYYSLTEHGAPRFSLRTPYTNNCLYSADKRFTVTKTGNTITYNAAGLFDGNLMNYPMTILDGEVVTLNIDLIDKDEWTGNGLVYSYGTLYIHEYYTYNASSVRARLFTKNGDGAHAWRDWVAGVNISSADGYSLWAISLTGNYNCQELEIEWTADGENCWVSEIEWNLNRDLDGRSFPLINKSLENNVYADLNFKNSSNVTVLNIGVDGLVDGVDVGGLKTAFDALDYYTQAQVDAHNWLEADITDLDKYTVAEVDAIEDRFDEKSAAFPGAPVEGDLHYDTVDEALYRYSGDALAWIQIGGAGVGSNTALTLEQARTNSNQVSGTIDMNQNLIVDLPAPSADNDVVRKVYVDVKVRNFSPSNDIEWSNDTERTQTNSSMVKIKEITVYRNMNIRVYWQHKASAGVILSESRVYINGVGTGATKSNPTVNYVAYTEDVAVQSGDLLQIYARAIDAADAIPVYVRYQRIQFIEYVNTGGY